MSKNFRLDLVIAALPLSLVLGSFTIAVIDPNYRQPFMDLTQGSLVLVLGRSGVQRKIR